MDDISPHRAYIIGHKLPFWQRTGLELIMAELVPKTVPEWARPVPPPAPPTPEEEMAELRSRVLDVIGPGWMTSREIVDATELPESDKRRIWNAVTHHVKAGVVEKSDGYAVLRYRLARKTKKVK